MAATMLREVAGLLPATSTTTTTLLHDWAASRLQSASPSWTRTDDSTTKAQPPSPGEARTNFGERQAQ